MYSKAELEAKAHIELINIAKELGIPRATRLDAQELMYKIIALQSENPKAITKEQEQQKAKESESRPKRARIKPTLLAESSLNNPELHKRKNRPDQNSKPQASGTAQPKRDLPSRPAVESSGINIADLEVPSIPSIPDVVTPSGRLLRRYAPTPSSAPEPQTQNSIPEAAAPAPAPEPRPGRRDRGPCNT